jgi:hypothetical protein
MKTKELVEKHKPEIIRAYNNAQTLGLKDPLIRFDVGDYPWTMSQDETIVTEGDEWKNGEPLSEWESEVKEPCQIYSISTNPNPGKDAINIQAESAALRLGSSSCFLYCEPAIKLASDLLANPSKTGIIRVVVSYRYDSGSNYELVLLKSPEEPVLEASFDEVVKRVNNRNAIFKKIAREAKFISQGQRMNRSQVKREIDNTLLYVSFGDASKSEESLGEARRLQAMGETLMKCCKNIASESAFLILENVKDQDFIYGKHSKKKEWLEMREGLVAQASALLNQDGRL